MNPFCVSLIDSRCIGQSPLRKCADGCQTLDHLMRILASNADSLSESNVAFCHCLDWVVMVLGKHSSLELSYNTALLTQCAHICRGAWLDAVCHRLGLVCVTFVFARAFYGNNTSFAFCCVPYSERRPHYIILKIFFISMALSGIPVMDNYNKEKTKILNMQRKYLQSKNEWNRNKSLRAYAKQNELAVQFIAALTGFYQRANAVYAYLGIPQQFQRNPQTIINLINRNISRRLMPKTPNR